MFLSVAFFLEFLSHLPSLVLISVHDDLWKNLVPFPVWESHLITTALAGCCCMLLSLQYRQKSSAVLIQLWSTFDHYYGHCSHYSYHKNWKFKREINKYGKCFYIQEYKYHHVTHQIRNHPVAPWINPPSPSLILFLSEVSLRISGHHLSKNASSTSPALRSIPLFWILKITYSKNNYRVYIFAWFYFGWNVYIVRWTCHHDSWRRLFNEWEWVSDSRPTHLLVCGIPVMDQ